MPVGQRLLGAVGVSHLILFGLFQEWPDFDQFLFGHRLFPAGPLLILFPRLQFLAWPCQSLLGLLGVGPWPRLSPPWLGRFRLGHLEWLLFLPGEG